MATKKSVNKETAAISSSARKEKSKKTATSSGKVRKPTEKTELPMKNVVGSELITDYDVYLFKEGKHFSLYEKLGAHVTKQNDIVGVSFGVWAPNARTVSVIGDFNDWNKETHQLIPRLDDSGIWQGFIPELNKGTVYKYYIHSNAKDYKVEKADPFAFYAEQPPKTASVVWDHEYKWNDGKWMKNRASLNHLDKPMAVYELHLESWRKKPEEGNKPLSYSEIAHQLVDYVNDMGYTHVELMPVMEHPYSGSWGYQVLGFFCPTSRFGNPQDFMYFVDYLHQNNIAVILDWVPSHFPGDLHGIHFFDGTYLYEHEDPRQGYHPDWSSYIFNYGRNEVKEFLISSAQLWLDKYHIDGLRVDAVASMLYLDYSRKEGEWIPNKHGGRENLDAINFMRELNEFCYTTYPGIQTIAEESTAWPSVTRPVYTGGLGFGFKWNMGWMNDTLSYFSKDPVHRHYHHNQMTFSIWYAFNENFMLPFSHDEVVHGKGSLINKMPGDDWQKFANLRALIGYMYGHPGKKLLFMGCDFGQWNEWNYQQSLDWHLTEFEPHNGVQQLVRDLNSRYKEYPALYDNDFNPEGFRWLDPNDSENSIISFMRFDKNKKNIVMCVCNFTPIVRHNYRIGVPNEGHWKEILNTDAKHYGGSGQGNFGGVDAVPVPYHTENFSVNITLPPLGVVLFSNE